MEKNDTNKTILIVVIAIVALCGCMIVSCCAFSFYILSHIDREDISEFVNSAPINTGNDTALSPADLNDPGSLAGNETELTVEGLTADELKIIQLTEETRGITAETKLAPVYKTTEELRQDMIDQLQEVTDEELADELALYNILGFAPEDFDLRQFYVDLYTEQIAGFYDPDENAMYLITDTDPRENALTLAHEYTHYLQYNYEPFDEVLNYDDDFCEKNGETCIVIDALVEGDASLTENLLDVEETVLKAPDNSSASEPSSSVFDNSPKFFQDSLLFPYLYGFDFVAYHYLKGGFDAVNDLFINLPESAEQIMHPEKYLTDSPVSVTLEPFRSMIIKDFEIVQEDVMNEADIMELLGSGYDADWQLSERQASAGAEGWGGGSYIFARSEGKPLFFTKVIWDSEDEAKEAETTFAMYSDKRFGNKADGSFWQAADGSSVYLIRQDDVLYWMILPDNFDAESFVETIRHGSAL